MARRTCNQGMGRTCEGSGAGQGAHDNASRRNAKGRPKAAPGSHIGRASVLVHTQFLFQVVDVDAALAEAGIAGQVAVQRHVGLDAVDHDLVEGVAHARQGLVAGVAVGDDLADQRVVVRRYGIAAVQVRIVADAVAARGMVVLDLAGAGHEGHRVFGVDTAFQRVAADHHVFLADRQLVAGGDAEHLLDDVHAGDHFGHRVFDLHAGVHLDEVEATVFIEELEGAGAAVADLDTGIHAALEHLGAGLLVDLRGGGFLQYRLVTALQRAVAVIEVDGVALAVGQHLDLHMARIAEELLQVDYRVAERGTGFGAGQLGRLDQVLFLVDHAHAATTAAAGGLDDHRVA